MTQQLKHAYAQTSAESTIPRLFIGFGATASVTEKALIAEISFFFLSDELTF
jgi:hypothetical protein